MRLGWEQGFVKMHGSGNDFVVVVPDGVSGESEEDRGILARLCDRKKGVGADGVIFVEPSRRADCKLRFFNPDGGEVEFCGNGCRCGARFAYEQDMAPRSMFVETLSGVLRAVILENGRVRIQMPEPTGFSPEHSLSLPDRTLRVFRIHTGVPHAVVFVSELDDYPVASRGRAVRFHEHFQPEGTNVDFVRILGDNELAIRTYERGVEDETLSCGTGAVAAALVGIKNGSLRSPVRVLTRGGETLTVFMDSPSGMESVYLEGDTSLVYSGTLLSAAFMSRGG